MVVLASITLTGVTVVSIQRVQSELSSQIGRQLEAQAESLNNLTAFFLLDKISDLRVLVTSEDLIELAQTKNRSHQGAEESILAEIQARDRVWVEDGESQNATALIEEVTAADRERNPAAFQLARFLKTFHEHTELLLTDRYGATIAATGHLSDYYQADEAWWKSAWEGGKGHVYIEPPRFDDSAGITAMLIAVPVFNGGDEPVGVLRSTLNVADVLGVISGLTIGKTGHASLMDLAGNVFNTPRETARPDSNFGPDLHGDLAANSGHHTDTETIMAHARLIRDNFNFGAIASVDDAIVDAVMKLGLVTVVHQDRSEALATVKSIESSGRMVLGVAVVASVFIALLAARIVTTPLKRLSLAAEAMGRGRLDTPLPPAYSGEISDLTENLATMASRLQDLIASLEARSEELAESNQALMREVGERVRAEQELTLYRDQLEVRIEARTRELELVQVELMRREKLASLGQLTEKIAQEIRSPLGTVAASLYLIRKSDERAGSERVEGALDRAERSIKRCDRIVSELFTYSDRQQPSFQNTVLDSWIGPVIDQVERPPMLQCTFFPASNGTVHIDRERLHQAIDCVLLNAIQATEEIVATGGTVRIDTVCRDGRVEIRVSDRGPGIAVEIESQIFEPLFSTKPMGIGLGLPLVRAIMEEHGGGVEITAREGGGTTVILWLPLVA
jgi:signal transduction histidine kinase